MGLSRGMRESRGMEKMLEEGWGWDNCDCDWTLEGKEKKLEEEEEEEKDLAKKEECQ